MAGVPERCKGYEHFSLFLATDGFDDAYTYNSTLSAEKWKQYAAESVCFEPLSPCPKYGCLSEEPKLYPFRTESN